MLGMKCLNFSASFYEEEPGGEEGDSGQQKPKNETGEKLMSALVTCFAVVLALGIMEPGTAHHIGRRQRPSPLDAVDALMLRAVIAVQPADVFRAGGDHDEEQGEIRGGRQASRRGHLRGGGQPQGHPCRSYMSRLPDST